MRKHPRLKLPFTSMGFPPPASFPPTGASTVLEMVTYHARDNAVNALEVARALDALDKGDASRAHEHLRGLLAALRAQGEALEALVVAYGGEAIPPMPAGWTSDTDKVKN